MMKNFENGFFNKYKKSLKDALSEQSRKGRSITLAAEFLGIDLKTTRKYARLYNIVFKKRGEK